MVINETIKNYCICFILGICLALSVILPIFIRRIEYTNSKSATIELELSRAREEISRAGKTISELRTVQSDITSGLQSNNNGLQSVIEELQIIRDKMQDFEHIFSDYYSDSDWDYDLFDN